MFEKPVDDETALKLLERHHGEDLFRLVDANRKRLRPWMGWVETTREPADSDAFIRDALKGFAEGTCIHFGIWHRGKLAGVVGPHTIQAMNESAEIGYWIGREAEGHGILTRSCIAVIDYLVDIRGLNRIEARCAVSNHRSRRVMERLGMQHEGTLCQSVKLPHGFEDTRVYAVLAAEWRERRKRD
ncbi:GNAT family N-acetyltransferase [Desmospora profundinema]|uniref:Ribosomal-protein-serine acetyltransferase n=1 Tax=Desmospora profundinema TaxID=1571184 RepID=A0ABU1IN07_9BACL|nr:GNAT family protein [Desmospora profundinema]MDR6226153.1 ribosomal-protein-serine acetyltransferase [Desmospora profundinema]